MKKSTEYVIEASEKMQVMAVIREYNDALRDGNYPLAARIREANPDLIPDDTLTFVPEQPAGARAESPVQRQADWKVVTATLTTLEYELNKLSKEGYYPFSIIPQKGAYGIAHYVIVAGNHE